MWTPRAGSACSVARHGVRPACRVEASGIALPAGPRAQRLGVCCYSSSRQGARDREPGGNSQSRLPPLVAGACGVLAALQARHIYREQRRSSTPGSSLVDGSQNWSRDVTISWRRLGSPSSTRPTNPRRADNQER